MLFEVYATVNDLVKEKLFRNLNNAREPRLGGGLGGCRFAALSSLLTVSCDFRSINKRALQG